MLTFLVILFTIMMVICIKQHLKHQFMKKLSNTEVELKKSVAYKKRRVNVRLKIQVTNTEFFAFTIETI